MKKAERDKILKHIDSEDKLIEAIHKKIEDLDKAIGRQKAINGMRSDVREAYVRTPTLTRYWGRIKPRTAATVKWTQMRDNISRMNRQKRFYLKFIEKLKDPKLVYSHRVYFNYYRVYNEALKNKAYIDHIKHENSLYLFNSAEVDFKTIASNIGLARPIKIKLDGKSKEIDPNDL